MDLPSAVIFAIAIGIVFAILFWRR